jgi:hypothetical protein
MTALMAENVYTTHYTYSQSQWIQRWCDLLLKHRFPFHCLEERVFQNATRVTVCS